MSNNIFTGLSSVDLENGLSHDLNNDLDNSVNNNITHSATPNTIFPAEHSGTIKSNNCCANSCIKISIWFFIMIFTFPMMFCDLYFGYKDDTCVNEPVGKLLINLKDYLIISGWIMMSFLSIITIGLLLIDLDSFSKRGGGGGGGETMVCCGILSSVLIVLGCIFLLVWNIFGAIIFWSDMDTSGCSKNIYNYVFASLVIKIVFNGLGLLSNVNKKEK